MYSKKNCFIPKDILQSNREATLLKITLKPFNILYLIPTNFLFARFNMKTKISQKFQKSASKKGQKDFKAAATAPLKKCKKGQIDQR